MRKIQSFKKYMRKGAKREKERQKEKAMRKGKQREKDR